MTDSVVIRCDGSPEIGLGHVVRCLALARVLRDAHGCAVTFAMRRGPLGIGMVRDAGFAVTEAPPDDDLDYRAWLTGVVEEADADALVLDVRDDLTLEDVQAVRARTGVRVMVIDDGSERRLVADDVFYPPVPQVSNLEWPGFGGCLHVGWEWVLLRPEFATEIRRESNEPPVILITMGGSDPIGLTPKVVHALALVRRPIECVVLIGPGFVHDSALAAALDEFPHGYTIVRDGDVRERMLDADLGVLSFGVTAYEAAACALPAAHVCITEDHALSSSVFADADIAVSLGLAGDVQETRLAEAIDELLAESTRLRAMGRRARNLVDGGGATRIAEVIARWRPE